MTNEIEVGDVVVCKNTAFNKYPHLPKELQGKDLSVINLYKDPTTGKPLRAGVTCAGVDNPRSKYNCFNIGCNYLNKKPATQHFDNSMNATPQYVDKEIEKILLRREESSRATHYIIVGSSKSVVQIIPVTVDHYLASSNIVKVTSSTKGEFYVKRKMLFDTEADAREYLIAEWDD